MDGMWQDLLAGTIALLLLAYLTVALLHPDRF
nr:potassium-transporting ATPase subunit F [Knoellia locipacati]